MIERRNRQVKHGSKSMYLAIPVKTMPERNWTSAGRQTRGLARRSHGVAQTRPNAESLEQQQRAVVWWLMALLWLLFLLAGIILWNKAFWGS